MFEFNKNEERVINAWLDGNIDSFKSDSICFYTDGETLRLKTLKNDFSIGHTGHNDRKEFFSYANWSEVESIVYDYTRIVQKMMKKDSRIIDTIKEIDEEMKRRSNKNEIN